jgi:hypothetical protein
MERSPKFAENILARYGGKSEDIQDEILMFGCPYCGCASFDHRWIGDGACLTCDDCITLLMACSQESEDQTRAAIYEVLISD